MRILAGHDMEVAKWGFAASASRPIMFNAAHGILEDEKLVGAVLWTGWNGSDMEVHYYGPKTLSRGVVRFIFSFALSSGCNRLTVRTRKPHMARGVKKLGAVFEGTCRYFYGSTDSEDDTAEQYAFFKPQMAKLAGKPLDFPLPEPIKDLMAQARDLVDPNHPRKGLWLVDGKQPPALGSILHADVGFVPNFDGRGGLLVTQNRETAKRAVKERDSGKPLQQILGQLTGAGEGKPWDATHVVQQFNNGAVTRERAVAPHEINAVAAQFAYPGRQVAVIPIQQAIVSRLLRRETESNVR